MWNFKAIREAKAYLARSPKERNRKGQVMTIYPTIHSKGTSAKELLDQQRDAYLAIGAAIDAVCKSAPHGRDYYPQNTSHNSGDAYNRARDAHEARLIALQKIKDEFEAIAIAIQDQTRGRFPS